MGRMKVCSPLSKLIDSVISAFAFVLSPHSLRALNFRIVQLASKSVRQLNFNFFKLNKAKKKVAITISIVDMHIVRYQL